MARKKELPLLKGLRFWATKYFFRAIGRHRPNRMRFEEFAASVFLDGRDISLVVANKEVFLKGAVWFDNHPVEGLKLVRAQKVKSGTRCYLRNDEREPWVTIEHSGGVITIDKSIWERDYARFFKSGYRNSTGGGA